MTFGPYKATVARIHDGDTITVDIVLAKRRLKPRDLDLGFNVHDRGTAIVLAGQSVRLKGCNAAELATDAGRQALAYLQTILHVGDTVTLVSHGWDKYGGRIDGEVTLADGRDLTRAMINSGFALPWDGKGVKPVAPPVP